MHIPNIPHADDISVGDRIERPQEPRVLLPNHQILGTFFLRPAPCHSQAFQMLAAGEVRVQVPVEMHVHVRVKSRDVPLLGQVLEAWPSIAEKVERCLWEHLPDALNPW